MNNPLIVHQNLLGMAVKNETTKKSGTIVGVYISQSGQLSFLVLLDNKTFTHGPAFEWVMNQSSL